MKPSPSIGAEEPEVTTKSAAEAELVKRFYGRVFSMALIRVHDPDTARDLAQETMLAVLSAIRNNRVRDSSRIAAYVCATARNRISYFFRHRRVERTLDQLPKKVMDRADPEKALIGTERGEMAASAIESLGEADRKILRWTLVEGLKPREIAARLGISAEAVRKRRSRAIRRARKKMLRENLSQRRQKGYS